MPASTQIADDDVHNHPGISQIPDEDVHNHPSANPEDPTPLVSPTQIDPNEVPEFERPIAASANLAPDEEDGTSVAYSVGNKPKQIDIVEPNKYTSGVQAHELVHLAQYPAGDENTVDPSGLSAIKDPAKRHAAIDNMYGYGGTEGLDKIMKSGGISKLNDEQQASIPQNYMKEYTKAVKSGDTKTIDRLNEVYQPAIKQLRNMANPSTDTIDTTPDAPAGAPASLLGLAKPVKGMASNSTKSASMRTMAVDNPKGLVEKGNLNIDNRPVVKNADGSHSTEYSTSFNVDGKEVLVPTVVNGKFLTPDGKKPPEGSKAEKQMFREALNHYKQTGENLGKFKDASSANAYANVLHNRGEAKKSSWKEAASSLGRK